MVTKLSRGKDINNHGEGNKELKSIYVLRMSFSQKVTIFLTTCIIYIYFLNNKTIYKINKNIL